jgi:DNA polymerase III delta prime subunit
MNKKIGLIVEHYSFRSDIRELIAELSTKTKLVLFIVKSDEEQIKKLNIEYRLIDENETIKNKMLKNIFNIFHKKHHLKYDLVSWKLRKIAAHIGIKQLLQIVYFNFMERIPSFFSYELLLKYLDLNNDNIDDIQAMITLTEIKYDELLSKCFKKTIPLYVYMYSWDHPIKLKKIGQNNFSYLVWNNNLKEDLHFLHNVDLENIYNIASTQLIYVEQYRPSINKVTNNNYIYYASSFARVETVNQEIDLIKFISLYLQKNKLSTKIIFRPYPNVENEVNELYESLKQLGNIEFDIYQDNDFIFTKEKIYAKYEMIQNSIFTLHTGSTFGMEACYFDVPNIFFTFSNSNFSSQKNVPFYLNLKNIINQYHLKKYLLHSEYKNVASSENDLLQVLDDLLLKNKSIDYLAYNRKVRNYTPLKSIGEIADNILEIIKEKNV